MLVTPTSKHQHDDMISSKISAWLEERSIKEWDNLLRDMGLIMATLAGFSMIAASTFLPLYVEKTNIREEWKTYIWGSYTRWLYTAYLFAATALVSLFGRLFRDKGIKAVTVILCFLCAIVGFYNLWSAYTLVVVIGG